MTIFFISLCLLNFFPLNITIISVVYLIYNQLCISDIHETISLFSLSYFDILASGCMVANPSQSLFHYCTILKTLILIPSVRSLCYRLTGCLSLRLIRLVFKLIRFFLNHALSQDSYSQ